MKVRLPLFLSLFVSLSLNAGNIDPEGITISGISSGSYMAGQLHTAHSKLFKGVGLIAGGPYYCSQGSISTALYSCAETLIGQPNPQVLADKTIEFANQGKIDSPAELQNSKIFILSGQNDGTVVPKVALSNIEFYTNLGLSEDKIFVKSDLNAGHAFPTENYGNNCEVASKSPYVAKCGYDTAKNIFETFYGELQPKGVVKAENFSELSQSQFFQKEFSGSLSMGDVAQLYTPTQCQVEGAKCKLHIAFHGCRQTKNDIGDIYYTKTGYNEWAESNGIVVLYPQAVASTTNPNGCWDWWGYSSSDFYSQQAPQIKVIKALIDQLVN